MEDGLILKGIGGFYYVFHAGKILECKARGIFRKDGISPLPGDYVQIENFGDGIGNIQEIRPRKNELIRPAISNVDCAVIVVSAKSPLVDFMLLDKLLITISRKDILPILCVNKEDIDTEGTGDRLCAIYGAIGYQVVKVCALEGKGIPQLEALLAGKISVFAGQSGVGKSTIINHIMNDEVMKTGEVSVKIERGKHTTRHAELIPLLNGGYIADTPGFSSFALQEMEPSELEKYYPEFQRITESCKFNGCAHVAEPECSVKKAMEEGSVDRGRYERYRELYQMLNTAKRDKYRR